MRILLVYPKVLQLTFPPLGILYIASYLRKYGHQVMVADVDSSNLDEVLCRFKEFNPQVVGISIVSVIQIKFAELVIKKLKIVFPEAFFICGGTVATVFPRRMLNDFGIDIVVKGEGEETAREILEALDASKDLSSIKGIVYKNKSEITENGHREVVAHLDDIPPPARDLIDFRRYLRPPGVMRGVWFDRSTSMLSSRGCPAQCIYCGSHLIFGRKLRRRSVDNVILEMKSLIDEYKLDGVWFIDDTFTIDKKWVIDFTKRLRDENINLRWGCQARVNTVDLEMLSEMKKAGCVQVDFGVESGSPQVLKILKKGANPEMVRDAFGLCKKVGLRSLATFMVGNPGETYADIEMTKKLVDDIKPDFSTFFFTTPYPGTELFDMANSNQWLRNSDYQNWSVRNTPVLEINFKPQELIKIRAKLQNRSMIRNMLSTMKDPSFFMKMICFLFLNIPAFMAALKATIKTRNMGDFVFYFFERANAKS